MKKITAKLRLDRETLKQLSSSAMRDAAGGAGNSTLPTVCQSHGPTQCASNISDCPGCPTTTSR